MLVSWVGIGKRVSLVSSFVRGRGAILFFAQHVHTYSTHVKNPLARLHDEELLRIACNGVAAWGGGEERGRG